MTPHPQEVEEALAWADNSRLDEGQSWLEGVVEENAKVLAAELRRQSQELERAREIVRRIGEGHNPHRKCLAPSKCCPRNRLCFPCLANDFLAQPAPEKP